MHVQPCGKMEELYSAPAENYTLGHMRAPLVHDSDWLTKK